MMDPNADSPLNCDAGNLIRNGDVRGFHNMARMYTVDHAINDPENPPGSTGPNYVQSE